MTNEEQALVNGLKIRAFDAEDQVKSLTQTLNQFSGALAQALGLTQEQAQDPQEYLKAIAALKPEMLDGEKEAPTAEV